MAKKTLSTSEMEDSLDDFDAMYRSHAPLIYRFMFWRTKDAMLAEDLTSNVFEKAWRARSSYSGGSAKSWLYKIAHNTLIDYWRKKKELTVDTAAIMEMAANDVTIGDALDSAARQAEMLHALTKLPADMSAVLWLRFMVGLSSRQTAERLSISEANVRVMQHRALRKLRNYLQ